MRTLVLLNNGTEMEFDADGVAAQPGILILVKGETPVATFAVANIVGIWHPDGPPRISQVN